MVLIINGTNRRENKSQILSKYCYDYLVSKNVSCTYLSLETIENDLISSQMYIEGQLTGNLKIIHDEYIKKINKWIIVAPEYNASFPGILKLFFDVISVNNIKETFNFKQVALIGVSDGRSGNLRGLEHMSNLLNYLKMNVYFNKLPISMVNKLLYENQIIDEQTKKVLNLYLDDYILWPDNIKK